jgi:hypothetical protein
MALICYTNEVIWLAKKFNEVLSVERIDITHKYKISIKNVMIKDEYRRLEVYGLGFTIEDACNDYLRLCRGYDLAHTTNNVEIEVV